jgi:MHS family proline/betaine transporter-like MFS transporter
MTTTDRKPAADAVPASATKQLRKVVLAGSMGVFVEFYDYGAYGFLAATIAKVFFPDSGGSAAIMMTWGIFALTFFVRPLGGVVIGSFADRIGRRAALVLSLMLMSGATTVIGLLPSYASIGIAAPILLLTMRLIQGFSAGGEVASAMAYVGENAPVRRRGFMMSWAQVGSFTALLLGTSIGVMLSRTLSAADLQHWGWRIPFLVGAPLGLIGYYIRRRLEDSPVFTEARKADDVVASPLKATFTDQAMLRRVALAIGLTLLNSSGYYILFSYMPSYLNRELKFTQLAGLGVTSVALIAIIIAIPVQAALSDRFGRKPVLLISSIGLTLLALPCYALMTLGSIGAAIGGAVVMAVLFAGHTGIIHAVLVELFPTRVRGTAYSLGYNVSTAIFGGAAPLIMTAVIASTGNHAVPAYYVVLTAIGTTVAILISRESSRLRLENVSQ